MKNNYVVIMAGGIGSRFWPFSTSKCPKQFLDILGTGKTLLQQTVARFAPVCPSENIYIVTNEEYKGLVKEQLPFMLDEQILLEPVMRNTAPCIAYASYKIAQKNPQANLVVAPADHIILNESEFVKQIHTALAYTQEQNLLVTLGIQPSRPDTGYGYIQVNDAEPLGEMYKVKTFTEKPDLELAKTFVESGEFVWNAGIFIWKAESIIQSFRMFLPEIAAIFEEQAQAFYTDAEQEAIKVVYYQCKNISIDYGIMEKAKNVYVLRSDFGWSDLGTWKSLFEVLPKDEAQNVLHGNVIAYDTQQTIVKSSSQKLIVIQGLDNYIVADHGDVLLICQKDQEQRIKQFVADVKAQKGAQYL